jgi:hypothetical protein
MGWLVLRKELDETKPEKRRHSHYANKHKGRSFFEFSHDPASIESKAGRIPKHARQMQLATGKGGLLIHWKASLVSI